MKKILLLIPLIIFSAIYISKAQVGIGNTAPDTTSVLDLTNINSKGVLLPISSSINNMSVSTGMIYLNNNNIYYKQSNGYNALSPWKFRFNGNTSNDVYFNLNGYVGIGMADITISPIAPLQIEVDKPIDLVENGSFLIGNSLNTNIAINSTEIQTRDVGSPSDLTINKNGGDVTFGSETNPVNVKTTKYVYEYDHSTHQYYDLLPMGSIIMWYGIPSNIPTGWALCDGNDYVRSDNNGSLTTPDLKGRFVVAAGDNGESSYNAHAFGGQDSVALSLNELATHSHTGHTSTNGNHRHTLTDDAASFSGDDGEDNNGADGEANKVSSTEFGGAHTHTIITSEVGGGKAHENRPKYYALTYIMKL